MIYTPVFIKRNVRLAFKRNLKMFSRSENHLMICSKRLVYLRTMHLSTILCQFVVFNCMSTKTSQTLFFCFLLHFICIFQRNTWSAYQADIRIECFAGDWQLEFSALSGVEMDWGCDMDTGDSNCHGESLSNQRVCVCKARRFKDSTQQLCFHSARSVAFCGQMSWSWSGSQFQPEYHIWSPRDIKVPLGHNNAFFQHWANWNLFSIQTCAL